MRPASALIEPVTPGKVRSAEAAAGATVGRKRDRSQRSATETGPSVRIVPPALLLFASGAAALVYQVLWIKQVSLVVGVDVYAITIGVSAFFLGLAIGSAIFGRIADRFARPVRLYALLEGGVAVLGVAVTIVLPTMARPFASLEATAGPLAWGIVFVLVGVPAILMGGTLPVLVRALSPRVTDLGATGGTLYAANTAGAIVAALLTSFLLIPWLGVCGSAVAAAVINLVAAAGAMLLDRGLQPLSRGENPEPVERASNARRALTLYAIAGGIALGYEIVWTQTLVQFMSTRAFTFSIVLATYLLGLVIGSTLYARRADRVRNPWAAFGLLIAGAGILALLEIAVLGRWPGQEGRGCPDNPRLGRVFRVPRPSESPTRNLEACHGRAGLRAEALPRMTSSP